jgi:hypothetical protein
MPCSLGESQDSVSAHREEECAPGRGDAKNLDEWLRHVREEKGVSRGSTALEDRTLQEELPGYEEYTRRVRYRLALGIW